MSKNLPARPEGYGDLLSGLVTRIREAQQRAAVSVTRETVFLYWSIGKDILVRQQAQGWGAKVIDRLAQDLQRAFPGAKGFSSRNLRNMRDVAREFPDTEIWQRLLPSCPWGHLLQVMLKVKDTSEREWYVRACLEHGWKGIEAGDPLHQAVPDEVRTEDVPTTLEASRDSWGLRQDIAGRAL